MFKRSLYIQVASLALICFGVINPALAKIRLPAIIGEHMVIQRGVKVPVWGWADPGETVTVEFMSKVFNATADAAGNWSLKLDVYPAGGPYGMTIRSAAGAITFSDVLVGDVWLASGQSNMEFGIQTEKSGAAGIPNAKDDLLHLFFVPFASSLEPQKDIAPVAAGSRNGKWIVCTPEAMADPQWAWHGFSAVGYYFAKELRNNLRVPVGMIATYKGGTPAQAWTSLPGLKQLPAFTTYVNAHQALVKNYETATAEYPAKLAAYQQAIKKWNLDPQGPKPAGINAPDGGFGAPANLYNAMVAPLVPYGIKGVIWYQGESNGDKLAQAVEYRTLFPRMISDWRAQWKQGDFPFLFVQLANFRKPATAPAEGNWAWVREAQLKTLSLPATGMAVITDIGDAADIHPTNKKDVGIRLALAARKVAYGQQLVYSGPVYRSMRIAGNTIELTFSNTGSGLTANGQELKGFGIAAADEKFVWANAVIRGSKVIVSSPGVTRPVAVRYNWADNPPGTLANKEGLLAGPFRTDDFQAIPFEQWELPFKDFAFHSYQQDGHTLPYRLHKPAVIDKGKNYPIVIFMHGYGERGTDNRYQFFRFRPTPFWEKYPCYVLAPQCPDQPSAMNVRDDVWVNTPFGAPGHTMSATPAWPLALAMKVIDQVIKENKIDKRRIYITGLSMGGFATWELLQRKDGFFAAAIPVCGGGDLAFAPKLAKTPLWIFHGDKDVTVLPKRSRDMTAALKAAGGDPIYTELPGVGHGAWDPAYGKPEVWDWLFAQKK
ncbi:sialate O-acetylesterase [Hufsiella ginkgonis]|uniref:Prolyl oligopeptidase family serine peptidase n=1 Tax=Hufsiella ginkgonis TaxID=2695274 RepID=A0A7K1Y3M8_9SPHI|nr:sialate O-acetylesterase [Hufsiella ginkgonis]MXV17649.1 prolyl oligopeptidase family serine peptidase [Hufsiella ginkgonis]